LRKHVFIFKNRKKKTFEVSKRKCIQMLKMYEKANKKTSFDSFKHSNTERRKELWKYKKDLNFTKVMQDFNSHRRNCSCLFWFYYLFFHFRREYEIV